MCTARRKAHEELRAYAATFTSDRAASPCARFLCFARLAPLPLDPNYCPPVLQHQSLPQSLKQSQSQLLSPADRPAATGHGIVRADSEGLDAESNQGVNNESPFSLWRELPINMDGSEAFMRYSLSDEPDVLASRVIEHGKRHNWAFMMTEEPSDAATSLAAAGTSESSLPEAAIAFANSAAEKIVRRYHTAASAAKMLV